MRVVISKYQYLKRSFKTKFLVSQNNEVVYVLFSTSRSSSDYGAVCLHKRMSNVIKQGII